ncbi:MAG: CBS domain-containing protein [Candidatus Zixiibacteriota bacterium]|nr:MAG: CBS domain-containing protein [candidate division Zixibacteria bacterium]
MDKKLVRDLMVLLDDYAVVSKDASLLDAVLALEKAQENLPPDRQPHRAVLVVDENKNVIGKIGQLAFLRALEPKYKIIKDFDKLTKAGVSSEFVSSMMEHFRLFEVGLDDLCQKARSILAGEVMHPVEESIDEKASLSEALHKMVIFQTLSILVTKNKKVVGLLRLSDLFEEIIKNIKNRSS